MKVAVTGGTGLIGSHLLVELAKQGDDILALKRATSSIAAVQDVFNHYEQGHLFHKIKWIEGDLMDIHSLTPVFEQVQVVYHAAAIVSFTPSDYDLLIANNVEGTANVVDACLASKVDVLAYVSSTAAIGRIEKIPVVTEDLPWDEKGNATGYSISKHYAEREVWRGSEEGLNVTMVNPCIVLGPGKWGSSSTTLLDSAYDELPFYSTGANAFVDARDVAAILVQLVEQRIFNERFLVIGENMAFRELFRRLAHALNKKPPHINTPAWLTGIAWRLAWVWSKLTGTKPKITRETAKSAQRKTVYSRKKIELAIPNYSWYTVDEAIENASSAYLKYKE